WNWGSGSEENRYDQKRISTTQYFNRYFSYTVIEGDISDTAFDLLLSNINEESFDQKVEETKKLIQTATPGNFIEKIRYKEKLFDSETSIALCKVFSQLGDSFPDKGNNFYPWFSSASQAAIFIAQL